jgi:putative transposase
VLTGRRYLLDLTPEQEAYAEQVAGVCRAVWNTALEQRRIYRQRGALINYAEQCRQLTDARREYTWLAEAPAHCLQQALRDLDQTCGQRGTFRVHWRSARRWAPSFRFPDYIRVRRLNRRWGEVRLQKFGWVRFRWTRSLGGHIRNATMLRDGGRWYVSFCVETGQAPPEPNGLPPVGVDRGVVVAVATSAGDLLDREFITRDEAKRLRRLQRQLARQRRGSARRQATKARLSRLHARIRHRREDFAMQTAQRLASRHGLVVVEDLNVKGMTATGRGTVEQPGQGVRQKAGLNRVILGKGWGRFHVALGWQAVKHGSQVATVNPAYTSQRCSACGVVDGEARESQAVFRCRSCGHTDNADVNAAKNILAAGLAVTGRGDLATRAVCEAPTTSRDRSMNGVPNWKLASSDAGGSQWVVNHPVLVRDLAAETAKLRARLAQYPPTGYTPYVPRNPEGGDAS